MPMPNDDLRLEMALLRYQIISSYLVDPPPRGQRRERLEQLAAKKWPTSHGELVQFSAETIRSWIRRYRKDGFEALKDKPRPKRGVSALSPEIIAKACALKKRVPERTLERIIQILEVQGLVEVGEVKRSTLHRALQTRGMSRRPRTKDRQDLDRFEAANPNDLWQSDMLIGPWLPDPAKPGRSRRTYLYAFLDDHSRLLLHGRFSFKGELPALELVFRRSMQKYGLPKRAYYDNGQVYRSRHMKQIVAMVGIHGLTFTEAYRPEGHGKIEALNRYIRRSFIAEVKDSRIRTLDELNEAFVAWAAREYNNRIHGETGQTPLDRWRAAIERVRYADDELLRQAFLWTERRTADKTGVFSLFGVRYQVGPELARRQFEVRYDPEDLTQVEVWHSGKFKERVRPLEIHPWRRPKPAKAEPVPDEQKPEGDYLGRLVEAHRAEAQPEPDPRAWKDAFEARRQENTDAILELLRTHLDEHVVDELVVRAWLARFGPLEPAEAEARLVALLKEAPADMHVRFYLERLQEVNP